MVRLSLRRAETELVAGLLATRSTRALQSVDFGFILDEDCAALAGELVSTDPIKQWRLKCQFSSRSVEAFCKAAVAAHIRFRPSSLVELRVSSKGNLPSFGALLAAVPTITHFELAEVGCC